MVLSKAVEKLLKVTNLIALESKNKVIMTLKWGFFYGLISEGLVDIG